jgi:putative ABC transport system substrate-binding protein
MIDRREFIAIMAASSVTALGPAHAQPAEKVWRIGSMMEGNPPKPGEKPGNPAFAEAMRDLGYVEGKNYVVERRYAEAKSERFPALAADLVRLKVDLIIVSSAPAVRAAKEATTQIPIVMLDAEDPVGAGLIASFARPGGNVTGFATPSLVAWTVKRLELLKTAAPNIKRVAWLISTFGGGDPAKLADRQREVDTAAQALGVSLLRIRMDTPQDFDSAIAAIVRERADALMLNPNPPNYILRNELAQFALKQRLPSVAGGRAAAAAGVLLSYSGDYAPPRDVAVYVDKIFKGANPGDLPVNQAMRFHLVVNGKTAKALGLTIPQSLLLRADEVLQ